MCRFMGICCSCRSNKHAVELTAAPGVLRSQSAPNVSAASVFSISAISESRGKLQRCKRAAGRIPTRCSPTGRRRQYLRYDPNGGVRSAKKWPIVLRSMQRDPNTALFSIDSSRFHSPLRRTRESSAGRVYSPTLERAIADLERRRPWSERNGPALRIGMTQRLSELDWPPVRARKRHPAGYFRPGLPYGSTKSWTRIRVLAFGDVQ